MLARYGRPTGGRPMRGRVVSAVVAAVAVVALVATPGTTAADEFPPGFGAANGSGIVIGPSLGAFPATVTVGLSFAGHQNSVATAEAQYADLGIYGAALTTQTCS